VRASRHELPGRSVLPYHPAFDGVRAVSVLAVMAFHASLPWARGGFLGVDVFFVLSGFLITTLLVGEHAERGHVRLRHFWMRRALRLFPALLVLIAVHLLWTWSLDFAPGQLRIVTRESIATLLYVSNWAQIWGWLNPMGTFGHTWSLAIEEQFYILWPLVLLFLLGTLSRTGTMFAVGGLAFASLLLRATLYDGTATLSRVTHGSDTRAETLLIGCLLALLLRYRALEIPPRPAFASLLALPGALALVWFFSSVTNQTEWLPRGGFTLVALSAAMLLLGLQLSRESPMARALSWGPLVAIGRISYGLYLWHWPIFVILAPKDPSAPAIAETAIQFAATFIAATLSWFLVERPALAWKARWS
jgi:peptidoglycan/LPS O-acetylase OafA/YrhL